MNIQEIEISGYRSVDDLKLELSNVTVLVGPNGCGKSNIYQSVNLIAAAATGQFARRIAEEGGMQSILWAGGRRKNEKPRVSLSLSIDELRYSLEFGLIPISERAGGLDIFRRDPDIKLETVEIDSGRKMVTLLTRKRSAITAKNMDGRDQSYPDAVANSESVLSELREPQKFPELTTLRAEFLKWRFYHDFRTDLQSPIREPQLGTLTPILSHDGHDLAATIATIRTIGDGARLDSAIGDAFPDSKLQITESDGVLDMFMSFPGVYRNLSAREFSDGTLQYLCILAALLTPRPAPFLVLNEPETSIHSDLFKSMAELVMRASKNSQILLTTHSRDLAAYLTGRSGVTIIELEKVDGATCVRGTRTPKTEEQKSKGFLGAKGEFEDDDNNDGEEDD
ncbi:MAG: recombinase RecF [Candidatus Melainabacteria bacterium]|nr:MAG: recombinase RecF [Candidatus Melainabacteria bacterium]